MVYKRHNSSGAYTRKDIYQEITTQIITAMESGNLPWQKAWDGKSGSVLLNRPINGKTGYPYTKENSLYLSWTMQKSGNSTDPRFFTFKQAQDMGYHIRTGSHGHAVKLGFFASKDCKGLPLPIAEQHWTYRIVTVFHATDCCIRTPVLDKDGNQLTEVMTDDAGHPILTKDGLPMCRKIFCDASIPPYVPKIKGYTHAEKIDLAENMLRRSGAKIYHDQANQAVYRPIEDAIHLPPQEAFKTLAGYYATALHELGHWTGHPSRLHRNMGTGFGSPGYAKEELRAEMASAYLSMDLGIPLNTMNHAAYTQSWLKTLKNDKMEFFKAANDAQKIANYLKDIVRDKLRTETRTEAEAIVNEKDVSIQSTPVQTPASTTKKDAEIMNTHVTIYQAPAECPWTFRGTHEVNMPMDFLQYKPVYDEICQAETEPANMLDKIYARHNRDDRPSGQTMRSVSISDVIQLDDRYFYVDTVGFTEIQITPIKQKQIMVAMESSEVERTRMEQRDAVGKEKFNLYQQKFHKAFSAGAKTRTEDCLGNPTKRYEKFLYDASIEYGLSSIRPCDQKAWQDADRAFIVQYAEDSLGSATALAMAACTVQELSPYTVISMDKSYGQNLGQEVLQSPVYKKMQADTVKEISVAR
jgi:antirestriction protein ArdC